jgi:ATP-binding cassette subfamily B protein
VGPQGNIKGKKYTLRTILSVNRYAYKCSSITYIAYILLNILGVVQTVVMLKYAEFTTNAIYRLFTKTSIGFRGEVNTIILFGVILAVLYLFSVVKQIILKKLTLQLTYNFEKDLNLKLSKIQWDYFEHHEASVKIHEVKTKALASMMKLIDSIMFYISTFISAFVYGFFLSQINIFVVAIYLALIVISTKLAGKVFDEVRTIWKDIQPYSQKQNYFFSISGSKVGHQEYRFNRLFSFVRDKWDNYFDEEYKLRIKIFKKYEITLQSARIILNTPYIVMLIYVSYEIVRGKHELGFLMLCQAMFNNIVNTFGSVQSYISNDKVEAKVVKSFFEVMELEEEPEIENTKAISGEVEFNEVEYYYPQSEIKALNGINLRVKAGEKIAIVGHNGSGKTTFTNLLMSLTENYSGNIKVDYSETMDSGFSKLRNSVSCILQDFSQYEITIRENIELGNIHHSFTDDEIIGLLEKVGLKNHILSLPKGIDTNLGQLDSGIELSKGQWQRLAIARLLANDKATIWILDEPTAYLDPLSEIEIYDLIYELAENRAVFFISHRLGFAKKAHRIIVFENGKIVESGVHGELMKTDGHYAKMYKNQESWYAA